MALKRIPLTHFVDRADRHNPKGLIRPKGPLVKNGPVVEFGLISAMRNPMWDVYKDYYAVDFRPRDNWILSRNREEAREMSLDVVARDSHGHLRADEDGAYVEEVAQATGSASLQVANEDANGLFSMEPVSGAPRISVSLAAIRVKELTTSSTLMLKNSPLGYFANGSGRFHGELMYTKAANTFQAVLYNRCHLDGYFGVPDETASVLTTGSEDKWILLQCVKVGSAVTVRLAGGQFGTTLPLQATLTKSFNPGIFPPTPQIEVWETDQFRVPIRKQARLAFATLAQYNVGGPATDEAQITWTIFEEHHRCGEYTIEGNQIKFDNTNQVSWEAYKKPSGPWYKQVVSGGSFVWQLESGGGDRYYYATGTGHTLNFITAELFSKIRPILRNTGQLNSETLAVIHSVSVDTVFIP